MMMIHPDPKLKTEFLLPSAIAFTSFFLNTTHSLSHPANKTAGDVLKP